VVWRVLVYVNVLVSVQRVFSAQSLSGVRKRPSPFSHDPSRHFPYKGALESLCDLMQLEELIIGISTLSCVESSKIFES
jgi:hypothetical protein